MSHIPIIIVLYKIIFFSGSAAILQSAADQYIAATATNMNFSRFSTSTAVATNGGWSVEEQLYKSKMWLKQRNQSMLSKPP